MMRDGSGFVTTPIYIGEAQAVAHAALCKHEFSLSGKTEKMGPENKVLVQMEKCSLCCAVRSRISAAEGANIEDLVEEIP